MLRLQRTILRSCAKNSRKTMAILYPLSKIGRVTSPFGMRVHPVSGVKSFHNGIDIAASDGTPIIAPIAGVLTRSYHKAGGHQLALVGSSGLRFGFAHLSRYSDHPDGSHVRAGEIIGYTGRSGTVTGPHLHFTLSLVTAGGGKHWFDPQLIDYAVARP